MRRVRCIPFDERMELYRRAMELNRKRKWGRWRISRYLNVSRGAVKHWLAGSKPDTNRRTVDLNPSPELSYILGVYHSDGYTSSHGYYRKICLEVKDEEFAEEFAECVSEVVNGDHRYSPWFDENEGMFRVSVQNGILTSFLESPFSEHVVVIDKFPSEFLRGVFDGDGCAYKKPDRVKDVDVGLSNSSVDFLLFVKNLLNEKFSITSKIESINTHPQLWIRSMNDVAKFKLCIGFTIRRKQGRLDPIGDP